MGLRSKFSYGFTDLLNQAATQQTQTQTPLFSTQAPVYETQSPSSSPLTPDLPDPLGDGVSTSTREARRRWSVDEDSALVSAWLNTSKDPLTANDQRAGAFWKRVQIYYKACDRVKDLRIRDSNHCKQRWQKINEGVQRFCCCFEQAGRQATSGQSEDDVFEMAYKFFHQDTKSNFTLEHAWRMLRNNQKLCALKKGKGNYFSKRSQPHTSTAGTPLEDVVEERPIGVKAAKLAKLKGSKSVSRSKEDREASLNHLQTVAALSEKEFQNKDVLADKQLLNTLLGKTEPLTEIENEIENKIIRRLF